jgi:putative resolvase
MKLSAYATHLDLSYQTTWRMWWRGGLAGQQLPSGMLKVDMPRPVSPACLQQVAVNTRVSFAGNCTTLDSQAERIRTYCAAKRRRVTKVVTECGAGVNDQRPRYLTLLAHASSSHTVVENKDRCTRLGVADIQTLLNAQGRESVIVSEVDQRQGQEALLQDLGAIISSFSARLYGRRHGTCSTTALLAALAVN